MQGVRAQESTDSHVLGTFAALGGVLALLTVIILAAWVSLTTVRFLYTSPKAVGLARVTLPAGATPRDIGRILEERRLIRSARVFTYAAWRRGFKAAPRSGEFWLDGSYNVFRVLDQIARGGHPIRRLTVPEGFSAQEIAGVVERHLGTPRDSVLALVRDTAMVRRFAVEGAPSLEGFLFPDTYFLDSASSARTVLTTMARRFHQVFTADMGKRAGELGLTPMQAVTLASIIEKEAAVAEERAVISQVFHRRLKLGMGLESDPTVKYAMASRPVNLSLADIRFDSPYNTYRYRGLPPGPICSPGKAALIAALYPADTDYLYFVANWDGTHTFTGTLQEHNRAKVASKQRYREWRADQHARGQ